MVISINRRDLLKGSAALALSASVGVPSRADDLKSGKPPKQSVVKTLQSDDRKLRMVPYGSPHFAELLRRYFPEIQKTKAFSEIVTPAGPMAVILNLVRGPDLIGHNIYWSITTVSGEFKFQLAKYHRPQKRLKSLVNPRVDTSRLAGEKTVLTHGGFLLVTPLFALSPDAYAKNPQLDSPAISKNGALQSFLITSAHEITDVHAYLDSAVYADHKVAGRDRGHLGTDIAIRRRAEIKLAKATLARLEHGKSKKAILQILVGTVASGNAANTLRTRGARISLKERAKYASTLAMIETHKGKQALLSHVLLVSQNPTNTDPFQRI